VCSQRYLLIATQNTPYSVCLCIVADVNWFDSFYVHVSTTAVIYRRSVLTDERNQIHSDRSSLAVTRPSTNRGRRTVTQVNVPLHYSLGRHRFILSARWLLYIFHLCRYAWRWTIRTVSIFRLQTSDDKVLNGFNGGYESLDVPTGRTSNGVPTGYESLDVPTEKPRTFTNEAFQ